MCDSWGRFIAAIPDGTASGQLGDSLWSLSELAVCAEEIRQPDVRTYYHHPPDLTPAIETDAPPY
jgi:hypothetical protein